MIASAAIGAMEDTPDLSQYLSNGDDLGAVYGPQETAVKLWAPTAKEVRLLLFNDATDDACRNVPMSRDRDGVWSASLKGDLDGKYYLYELTQVSGSGKRAV